MMTVHRPDARPYRALTRHLPLAGLLAGGAAALLLLAGMLHALASTPWTAPGAGGRGMPAGLARTIDPRLIVRPRMLTQAATVGGLRVALTVSPALPGFNRFALRLAERGRPVAAAHVHVVVTMTGMAMRPVKLAMREGQPGRYAVRGSLAMFGRWRLTIRIDRPGAAPLAHRFTVGVNLPAGLFAAQGAPGASHQ